VASLAASTLALLILVAVVASVGYVRTTRANVEEARQRKKAEDISALALEALDNIFQQFAPDRTAPASALLVVSDVEEGITVPVQPVLSKEAAALLENMLAFYDRLAAQGGDDAKVRRKVAEANRRVGDIRQRLGHYEESKVAYLRAIELYTRLADASAEGTELRTEIARIHNELGNVHCATNKPEAGRASYLEALATLQATAAESSAAPQHQYELARTYYFLAKRPAGQPGPPPPAPGGRRGPPGFVLDFRGPPRPPFRDMAPEEGEESLQKALALWGRLVADDAPWPPRGPSRPPEGEAGPRPGPPRGPKSFPAQQAAKAPAPQQSEDSLRKASDLLERLVAEHPGVPDYRHLLARCYREVSSHWFGRGAEFPPDAASRATTLLEKLVEEHPDVPDYRYELSETYAMLDARGPFAPKAIDRAAGQRSRQMLEKALAISEELVAEHPNIPDYAVSQVHLRLRLTGILQASDRSRAQDNLRKARDLQSTLVRRFPQNYSYKFWMAVIYESLAGLLNESGQLPEARSALQDSIALCQEVLQHDPQAGHIRFMLAHNYASLADLLRRMGEEQAAAEALRQAEQLRPGK
jgi:tetratricopeptide (TPR) repeat protein